MSLSFAVLSFVLLSSSLSARILFLSNVKVSASASEVVPRTVNTSDVFWEEVVFCRPLLLCPLLSDELYALRFRLLAAFFRFGMRKGGN